jgi:hypothetical protein
MYMYDFIYIRIFRKLYYFDMVFTLKVVIKYRSYTTSIKVVAWWHSYRVLIFELTSPQQI